MGSTLSSWTSDGATKCPNKRRRWMEGRIQNQLRILQANSDVLPKQTKPFQIECDTSKYVSGAILTQLDSNGDRHLCAFISKMFSPTERNYKIYDRELLAIIRALKEWRYYIQGSSHTTVIFSDHKNLTYFREARKLNQRQAWWSLYLL